MFYLFIYFYYVYIFTFYFISLHLNDCLNLNIPAASMAKTGSVLLKYRTHCLVHPSQQRIGFLSLGTVDVWSWRILCGGGLSSDCRMLSSTPGLYQQPVEGKCQMWQPQLSPEISRWSLRAKLFRFENQYCHLRSNMAFSSLCFLFSVVP